ncbi:hypothetical protein HMPREF1246_1609 [Acidaminococcus sp. BV3L6]|nr:hypothetical protein HMPREF1246_1609 [Acidaminococcus sp. BV3L6]
MVKSIWEPVKDKITPFPLFFLDYRNVSFQKSNQLSII